MIDQPPKFKFKIEDLACVDNAKHYLHVRDNKVVEDDFKLGDFLVQGDSLKEGFLITVYQCQSDFDVEEGILDLALLESGTSVENTILMLEFLKQKDSNAA
jgi:hypothetical protein